MQAGDKNWRVGKLAHDPLRSRCPRRGPQPVSSETTHLLLRAFNGVTRATWRSTRVVVQRGHENLFPGNFTSK